MESYPRNSDSDVYVFLYTILTPIVENRGKILSHITMTLEMKLPDGIFFFCKIHKGELVVTVTAHKVYLLQMWNFIYFLFYFTDLNLNYSC